jgi:hypothetical protein
MIVLRMVVLATRRGEGRQEMMLGGGDWSSTGDGRASEQKTFCAEHSDHSAAEHIGAHDVVVHCASAAGGGTHRLHENGFSPVCVRMWAVSVDFCAAL